MAARMSGLIHVDPPEFTETELRLLAALEDGKPVKNKALLALIDEHASIGTLRFHMCNIRTKMRRSGAATIISEDGCYRKAEYVK